MKKILAMFALVAMAANVSFAQEGLKGRAEAYFSLYDAVIDNDAAAENTIGFGISGQYYVLDNLSAGAELSMNNHRGAGDHKVNINMFGFNAKLYSQPINIGGENFNAYGVFGIGSYGLEVKNNGSKEDDRTFGFNYGAGLMYYFANHSLVTSLEIRTHHGFQAQLGSERGKAVYTNYMVNVGYRF